MTPREAEAAAPARAEADDRAERWAERLARAPEIDIDTWALLVEARIIEPLQAVPSQ